jgi:hypothetical protein
MEEQDFGRRLVPGQGGSAEKRQSRRVRQRMTKNPMSKTQIANMPVLRTLAFSVLALLALSGAGHAQNADQIQPSGTDALLSAKDAADAKAAKEYLNKMETDQKYQEMIRNQQPVSTSNDPWGSVRQAPTPAGKPAAKTAATGAKTATVANKPATGAIKPATGAAAPANGTTQKGQ